MFTSKNHFSSQRPDGRHVSSLASFMERLRHVRQEVLLPEDLTEMSFKEWQKKIRAKYLELLKMPDFTEQPDPVLLSSVQRDGYRVEKWEFYPDDYQAVPFLIMIPDGVDADHPAPGVMCLLGSDHTKEFIAGEPIPDHPNYGHTKFPERNQMGPLYVKNGMVAVIFDNLEIGECAITDDDPASGISQWRTRLELCHCYLRWGYNYLGMVVFQKLCAWKFLRTLPYIDHKRWAISAHSLGTEPAVLLGAFLDEVKVIIYNNPLTDDRIRYAAITEEEVNSMHQDVGNWHIVPGIMQAFGFPEMCAALAPKYLALTEGGAEEFLNTVEKVYEVMGVPENLLITHYPAFADPASRTYHGKVPRSGLSRAQFYREWSYCLSEDHSFRGEPILKHIKKAFGME